MSDEQDRQRAKLATSIKYLEESLDSALFIQTRMLTAKLRKANYDAFLLAGFTEVQALEMAAKAPL